MMKESDEAVEQTIVTEPLLNDRSVPSIADIELGTTTETKPNEFEMRGTNPGGSAIITDSVAVSTSTKTSPIFSRGVQLYCLAMLCGSLMKACSKLLVEEINLFIVLLARMSITAVLSVAMLRYLKVEHSFWGHKSIRVLLFVRGGLGFFNIVCTLSALRYLTLPDLAVISFLTPLVTSFAAKLFLKEEYRWQQALGSLVSLVGVVIIARPQWLFGLPNQSSEGSSQDLAETAGQIAAMRTLAVSSAMMVVVTASAVMIILRKIRDRAHALTSVANYSVLSVVGSLAALIFVPAKSRTMPKSGLTWGLILLVGLFGFLLQFLSSKAIQMEEATVLSNFKYTQLLYATVFEFVFWHDVPDYLSTLGMIFILSGVIWSARAKKAKT